MSKCGICGELRFDRQPADGQRIERIIARLERRGPDSGGRFIDGELALGHRRLAIIDLSARSNQPLVDEALGLVLVFNGTIYNYKALRAELCELGYSFFSEGDSEVILKAYHRWGAACVERLHGMFAFAIWERGPRRLFLARDRFGIKPLYYSQNASGFRFASNSQALLATGEVDRAIDPVGLHFLFSLHGVIPAPRTILQGIRKLPPAHHLTLGTDGQADGQTAVPVRYWQLQATR
ncbi:MAG: N-acetylglutaminylglutamine amidotransferase, partial [Gammaproteobacteria bacterium]|nr:N-acetylglutaminylglutamine amidotransferase [Gammaproteobacteria bacterium]